MKFLFLFLSFIIFAVSCCLAKDVYVHGYTRKDGTYVNGYHRSSPDNTVTNNYGFAGNVNPYTGKTGDNYYRSSPSSPYYGSAPVNQTYSGQFGTPNNLTNRGFYNFSNQ
jgi:hypothetical protein